MRTGAHIARHEMPLKRLNVFDNRLQKGTTKSTT